MKRSITDYFINSKKIKENESPEPTTSRSNVNIDNDNEAETESDSESEVEENDSVAKSQEIEHNIFQMNKTNQESNIMATGPADIAQYVTEGPCQRKLEKYPSTQFGKRMRSFKSVWFQKFPWMEYSSLTDSVYCFTCRFFANSNTKEQTFIKDGFRNWKRALENEHGFNSHSKSESHKVASIKYKESLKLKDRGVSICTAISEAHTKLIAENRHYIKGIAECLLLTCKLEIAQRGHDESMDSLNKGNFIELLKIMAAHDPIIKIKLENSANNAKYLHHSIQNELISIMARIVRKTFKNQINSAKYFAVLADETKDLSKKEQISIVVRYIFDGSIYERFLGYETAEGLDAESLTKKIKYALIMAGLDINNCVAQSYDGASVMSGHLNGVQARFKREVPHAIYIHCLNHVLNLVIVDVCHGVRDSDLFFDTLETLYVFVSCSTIHPMFVNLQNELYGTKTPIELKRISQTRWTAQYRACHAIEQTFEAIIVLLHKVANSSSARRQDAKGILNKIDQQFLVYLIVYRHILSKFTGISNYLQSPNIDYIRAITVIEELHNILTDIRITDTDNVWQTIWETVQNIGEKVNIQDPVRRQKSLPMHLQKYVVECNLEEYHKITFDSARQHIFYPILDRIKNEINERFINNGNIYKSLSAFNPKHDNFLNLDLFMSFIDNYKLEISRCDLEVECKLIKKVCNRPENVNINSVLKFFHLLEKYETIFEFLSKLTKIAITLPCSTASCERSFSSLKRIKTYLRTTMSDERLSDIAVLAIEKETAAKMNLEEVVDIFSDQHKNLRIILK